jgi:hypothetical protein
MNRLVRLLLIVVVVVAGPGLGAVAPAGATSCVSRDGVTPRNLLAGEALDGEALFERYDLAVVATVTAIRTNEAQGGATRTTVDVHAGFNVDRLPPTIDVSSDDPGWMNGYPFERGITYFIPVQHPGPGGQPHYSFVCDPILEVSGPQAATDLEAVATENGVEVARLVAAPPPPQPPAAGGLSMARVALIAGLAVLAMLGVVALAVLTGRRRPKDA